MSNAPIYEIDPKAFWENPYPDLKCMRAEQPISYVPQLGATLITRRDDIFENEKRIEIFSSVQPEGLMTRLMGQNLMRKDGEPHVSERKAIFPTVSPRTAKTVWRQKFEEVTSEILDDVAPAGKADMARDIARRISGEALKNVTGLTNISWEEMDRVSQGMIDGCANYTSDPKIEANCHNCTAAIERYIEEMIPVLKKEPDTSLLSIHLQGGLSKEQIYANVKLAISGGQNEVRDVIAGEIWALLNHPEQLKLFLDGNLPWMNAFEEYSRWISPVGMSPRRVAQQYELHGVKFEPEDRVFLMFGSGNRDETVFAKPDKFDVTQDFSASIALGAGPHFCAGAWVARVLISEVALPMIFERLKGLRLDGETTFGGWAFRGPLTMPVAWNI